MFGLIFLGGFLGVESLTRGIVILDNVVRNCSYKKTVFESMIGETGLACFRKYDLVRAKYGINFFDLNLKSWFHFGLRSFWSHNTRSKIQRLPMGADAGLCSVSPLYAGCVETRAAIVCAG